MLKRLFILSLIFSSLGATLTPQKAHAFWERDVTCDEEPDYKRVRKLVYDFTRIYPLNLDQTSAQKRFAEKTILGNHLPPRVLQHYKKLAARKRKDGETNTMIAETISKLAAKLNHNLCFNQLLFYMADLLHTEGYKKLYKETPTSKPIMIESTGAAILLLRDKIYAKVLDEMQKDKEKDNAWISNLIWDSFAAYMVIGGVRWIASWKRSAVQSAGGYYRFAFAANWFRRFRVFFSRTARAAAKGMKEGAKQNRWKSKLIGHLAHAGVALGVGGYGGYLLRKTYRHLKGQKLNPKHIISGVVHILDKKRNHQTILGAAWDQIVAFETKLKDMNKQAKEYAKASDERQEYARNFVDESTTKLKKILDVLNFVHGKMPKYRGRLYYMIEDANRAIAWGARFKAQLGTEIEKRKPVVTQEDMDKTFLELENDAELEEDD